MQENFSNIYDASKYVMKILLTLCVTFLVFIVIIQLIIFFDITYSLATVSTQDDEYHFNIRTPIYMDMSYKVYCRVKLRGKTLGEELIGISADLENIKFLVIEQKDIIALVEQATPYIILFLIDKKEHIFWPSENNDGKYLLEKLNKGRETPFVLSGEVFDRLQRV